MFKEFRSEKPGLRWLHPNAAAAIQQDVLVKPNQAF
jgi:hypothetical protein